MKKNILIIGGSYGIGLFIVQSLEKDFHIYVASRTKGELNRLNVTHILFDAATDNLNLNLLPEQIHGFVYMPGSIELKPFKRIGLETFKADMEINFFNLVKVVKDIISRMADNSSMVFFSSVAAGSGMPFHTSIAASKGAIEGFTRSLAAEYAPKIRVNVIAPSIVDTPLASKLLNNDKKQENMSNRHPLKRIGNPQDIGNTALFLLSDKSSWITGQVIAVDGGISTLKTN
ncbi:SDR family NAD(P)-dependent oxidoreductase [Arenibacter certesii]|uniref:Oxidoreductase n=1 Tax=Arenibacter certesii TaxID=228955 RepID=A0A918IUW6_9FLAO|nr:SDR family oxidoreductase [Arenibacter certesii]GGW31821.1 oxidoreductase [Arenibacter certesii]